MNESQKIDISNPTVSNNMMLYFTARAKYGRFHYTDIYTYARAIMNLDPKYTHEQGDKLLKEIDDMHDHPLAKIYDSRKLSDARRPEIISFYRLEYWVWRQHHYPTKISQLLPIDDRNDICFGDMLDILETFKTKIHFYFTQFLADHNVPMDFPLLPEMAKYLSESPKTEKLEVG